MTIGTDTSPQNILRNMRLAALGSRISDESHTTINAEDVFNAATLGGAKALGRNDLGRLYPGAKADLVIFDPETIKDRATYVDPLQYPVGIEYVIVNGQVVVERENQTRARPGIVIRKG